LLTVECKIKIDGSQRKKFPTPTLILPLPGGGGGLRWGSFLDDRSERVQGVERRD